MTSKQPSSKKSSVSVQAKEGEAAQPSPPEAAPLATEARASGPSSAGPESTPGVFLAESELQELRQKAAERDGLLNDLQRARADYINLQRRTSRDRVTWSSQAIQKFALDLLLPLDQLELALASAETSQDFKVLSEGIGLVRDSLLAVLRQHKLEPIQTLQERFNPALHEAVLQEDRLDLPDMTVLSELRRGYTLEGKVLRPAQVKVSRNPGQEKPCLPQTPPSAGPDAAQAPRPGGP
ncbi:MAG: nucleotide exchange factor GrpE [Planctomycetes bacterium]|nr:nucleotide exchange factor GrpE [Planctomycetota bacterium]